MFWFRLFTLFSLGACVGLAGYQWLAIDAGVATTVPASFRMGLFALFSFGAGVNATLALFVAHVLDRREHLAAPPPADYDW